MILPCCLYVYVSIYYSKYRRGGKRKRSWPIPYATNRRVVDSKPNEVNEFLTYIILPAALGSRGLLSL
jgi:hypothetical protein